MRNKFGWDIRKYTQFDGAVNLVSVFGKFISKYVIHSFNLLYHVREGKWCPAPMNVTLKREK